MLKIRFRISALLAFLLTVSIASYSQKPSEFQGHVQFAVTLEAGEGIDKSFIDMMPKINNIDFYLKGKKSKMITVMDPGKVKEVLMFPNAKGETEKYSLDRKRKLALKMKTIADNAAIKKENFVKTKTTKVVAGYQCTLYTSDIKDPSSGQQVKMNSWVTKDLNIKLPQDKESEFFMSGIDGFPVSTEVDMTMFKMVLTVSKVEKLTLPDADFAIPDGFTKRDKDHKINGMDE